MKSSKSLKREGQEESSSLGCNDSATANLVGMYSIVMDNWSDYKISIFIFFLLSIVNPFIFALYLFSFFSFFFHLHLFFISFLKIGLLFSSYLFFLFVFGQRPQIGTRTCRMGKNSVCLSICPSPFGWPSDTAGWPSGPSSWPSDPSSWPSDPSSWPWNSTSWPLDPSCWPLEPSSWLSDPSCRPEGHPAGSEGHPGGVGGMDRWTDRWMDNRNFFPYYKTLSPLRAAALLP